MPQALTKNVVVISGPTGSGESTVTKELISRFPGTLSRLVTATTRAPRHGEEEKVDYYFFSKAEFEAKIASGDILEYTYIENRDTYYGTYKVDLEQRLEKGTVIINADIVGARYFKEHFGATTIFIVPENVGALQTRLKKRNPDMSEEELAKRLENAVSEIQKEGPFYDYRVTNADGALTAAVDEVIAILKKEGYQL